MNIEDLIKAIAIRPGMFVYPVNIESIYNFLSGYLIGIKELKIDPPSDPIDAAFSNYFGKWAFQWVNNNIFKEYEFENFAWFTMFQAVTQDDKAARELFFSVCEEFFECCRSENEGYWNKISY